MHSASPPGSDNDDLEEAKTVLMAGPSADWMIEDLQARYARSISPDGVDPELLGQVEDPSEDEYQAAAYFLVEDHPVGVPEGTLEHEAIQAALQAQAQAPGGGLSLWAWVAGSVLVGAALGGAGLFLLTLIAQ
jgi:hypothetical protein